MNQQMTAQEKFKEAERLKQEKQLHEEMILMQRKQDEEKARSMKQMIKSQKDEQKEMREQQEALKKQEMRLDLIRRINEENERRIQIQIEVDRLEKEEAEWLKKLKNTSLV